MKKLFANFVILIALAAGCALPATSFACDRSSLVLHGVSDLGNGSYKIDMSFSCGAGQANGQTGAWQNTHTYAFFLHGDATVASYPGTLASPNTGATYTGFTVQEDTVLAYDNPTEWWACITGNCGPIQTVTQSISIITQGMPTKITLLGMEAAGNPVLSCTGPSMEIDFVCNNLNVDAGPNRVVHPDVPAQACVDLTAFASGGNGSVSYLWSTGATTPTINVCPAATTTYTVTVTDPATGCNRVDQVVVTATNCANLTANAGPDKIAYPAYSPQACVTLNGSATGGSGTRTYKWSTGHTVQNLTVCPSATTTYSLTVTNPSTGCTSVDQVTVTVKDISCGSGKVYVCQGGQTRCRFTSQVPSILASGGTLGQCGTNKSGDPVAAEAVRDELSLMAAPNPCHGRTNLYTTLPASGKVTLAVYDLNGRMVKSLVDGEMEAGDHVVEVELDGLAPGLYIARLGAGQAASTTKIMVQ